MAVWAIAWAGSKPLASLTDGLLAGTVGLRWTGFLLTLPALMPITVLAALMISVFAARAWKPQPRLWMAPRRRPFKSVAEWYKLAEFYLVSEPGSTMEAAPGLSQAALSADTTEALSAAAGLGITHPGPIRTDDIKALLIDNCLGGTADLTPAISRSGGGRRGKPPKHRDLESPWQSSTHVHPPSTATSTTTPGSAHSPGCFRARRAVALHSALSLVTRALPESGTACVERTNQPGSQDADPRGAALRPGTVLPCLIGPASGVYVVTIPLDYVRPEQPPSAWLATGRLHGRRGGRLPRVPAHAGPVA
jgi:hypothetical protein